MTAAEKSELGAFLHTAQSWVSGYRTDIPEMQPIPVLLASDGQEFGEEAEALLDKMLSAINLSRSDNCILADITCDITADTTAGIEGYISRFKPLIILTLGKNASQALLGTESELDSLRGRVFTFSGIPVMATYHPEELLQNGTLKRPAWEDLKSFRTELDRILAR